MSRDKLQVLKKYLDNNLNNRFIWALLPPAAAPVLFVKKPKNSLQFCVDYCSLNALTIKNKYPLPLIRKTLDWLHNLIYFTKLDIIATFNKIYMTAKEK